MIREFTDIILKFIIITTTMYVVARFVGNPFIILPVGWLCYKLGEKK
tara:strand:- start:145 stop:285 length:141 start_codon:yes stop_codon:yes gene_type:complete